MYTFVYDLYNAIGPIKYQYIVNMPLIAFHSMELTCRKFFISDSELLPKRLIGNLSSLHFLKEVERFMPREKFMILYEYSVQDSVIGVIFVFTES
jgi:hypothetical protein